MRYVLLSIIVVLLFLSVPVSATVRSRNCTGSYAWENITWFMNVTEYKFDSKPIYCPYGCADNGLECAEPAETDSGMLLTICVVLGMIAALFAYLSKNISWGGESYSWALQVLFMFGCLLFILLDIGIIAGFSTFTQNNIASILSVGYMAGIFIVLVALLFFMVLLVIKAVEYLISRGGKNKKD